jgi:very-short-patch-repair endonuclease
MSLTQAKTLRKQMTDAERRLWYLLRAHRFGGVKFNRQAPIGKYVADFVCYDRKLIIEADGGQHADNAADQRRDDWFASQGFWVLRFWNNDILKNAQGVLEVISAALDERAKKTPSPGSLRSPPSPTRGEGTPSARRDR